MGLGPLRQRSWRHTAAAGAAGVLLLASCVPSDPDGDPVAHQLDGDVLVLRVPLCPQERLESVALEDVDPADAASQGYLYERALGDPFATEVRIALTDVPLLQQTRSVLVSVTTSRRIRASALDLPEVPDASTDTFRLTDEVVSRPQVDAQLFCSSGG